jgi:hypothetical protein
MIAKISNVKLRVNFSVGKGRNEPVTDHPSTGSLTQCVPPRRGEPRISFAGAFVHVVKPLDARLHPMLRRPLAFPDRRFEPLGPPSQVTRGGDLFGRIKRPVPFLFACCKFLFPLAAMRAQRPDDDAVAFTWGSGGAMRMDRPLAANRRDLGPAKFSAALSCRLWRILVQTKNTGAS